MRIFKRSRMDESQMPHFGDAWWAALDWLEENNDRGNDFRRWVMQWCDDEVMGMAREVGANRHSEGWTSGWSVAFESARRVNMQTLTFLHDWRQAGGEARYYQSIQQEVTDMRRDIGRIEVHETLPAWVHDQANRVAQWVGDLRQMWERALPLLRGVA